MRHSEFHRLHRIGWLRAAVLGANDGIVSTASLLIGVAAAGAAHETLMITGIAGLVSGAMSMAAGEYVSVSSQADTEVADIARETEELATQPEHELDELTGIYISRGLTPALAREVALHLTQHDALAAHTRDELGIIDKMNAKPVHAALASAFTFAVGAALPLLVAYIGSSANSIAWIAVWSLAFLAALGGLAAQAGGAKLWLGAGRVAFWGALAMAATAAVGSLFGVVAA
jgi:VIT1/CCC1 family predicted Fe2+/Mn2+ transporter